MARLSVPDQPGLLRVSLSDEGVGIIQMDDATHHNALTHEIVVRLGEAFAAFGRDERVRAVVLAGTDDYFSSGASPDVIDDLASGRRDSSELLLPRLLLDCPVPCIAAMAGHAVGGGFALGVAADIVMLGAQSRYCLNFLDLGFTPGMGTTRLLEHVLSPAKAHELLYSGEARLGRDFAASGFNHVYPREDVLQKAVDLAERIADKPRFALSALKQALSSPRRQAFEAARTQEAHMHALSFAQPETAARIAAALGAVSKPKSKPE
jgi:polyketide biosynthesis enoyl-CoA hydratase PksI